MKVYETTVIYDICNVPAQHHAINIQFRGNLKPRASALQLYRYSGSIPLERRLPLLAQCQRAVSICGQMPYSPKRKINKVQALSSGSNQGINGEVCTACIYLYSVQHMSIELHAIIPIILIYEQYITAAKLIKRDNVSTGCISFLLIQTAMQKSTITALWRTRTVSLSDKRACRQLSLYGSMDETRVILVSIRFVKRNIFVFTILDEGGF